jgi:hypothetical protein
VSDSKKILKACVKELLKYGFDLGDTEGCDIIIGFMDEEWQLNIDPPTFSVCRCGCYNTIDFDIRDPNDFSVEKVVDAVINDLFQVNEFRARHIEGLRKMQERRKSNGIIPL